MTESLAPCPYAAVAVVVVAVMVSGALVILVCPREAQVMCRLPGVLAILSEELTVLDCKVRE